MEDRAEKVENFRREYLEINTYNRPTFCPECGGVMVFKGVGEYRCEKCDCQIFDDYGKVRNYLEKHHGATTAQVADATGVSQKSIRDMLKEDRLEITTGSKTFLQCEMCGTSIRGGRLCPKCEVNYHRNLEAQARMGHKSGYSGFSTQKPAVDDGSKRFTRDR
ncbi:MAG: hypothetical protein J6A08_09725 [Lachnospiraceae bacterium]|nr:hypothetical protein [Lachnospiraceae bacterium]